MATQLIAAEGEVQQAEAYETKFDSKLSEMEWVADHFPEPRAGQMVATELEQYASNQAQHHQLDVKRRAIMPKDETGTHFHRAKVEFNVSGKEDALYRWLDRLYMPDQLRAITFLRLSPDAKDDTLIDCTVHAEQWYVPLIGETAAESAEAPEATPEAATPNLPPGGAEPQPQPQVTPTPVTE